MHAWTEGVLQATSSEEVAPTSPPPGILADELHGGIGLHPGSPRLYVVPILFPQALPYATSQGTKMLIHQGFSLTYDKPR